MWRRVLACLHPDAGGLHEEFLFLSAAKEALTRDANCPCKRNPLTGQREQRSYQEDTVDRVPYSDELGIPATFEALTMRAMEMCVGYGYPYRSLLALLTDCIASDHGRQEIKQRRGASYKQLAYAAPLAGLGREERTRWYEIAESIPLSECHASHIIKRLKGE